MKLPPYALALGIVQEPGEDAPVLLMPFGAAVIAGRGFLHGGALGGLLEMAAIGALKAALGEEGRVQADQRHDRLYARRPRQADPRPRASHAARHAHRQCRGDRLAGRSPKSPIAAARMNYLVAR